MNFLVDQGLSPLLASWLCSQAGGSHNAVHVRDIGLSRATDAQILDHASREQRIVVTADLDFPRLLALSRAAGPSVILFRACRLTDDQMVALMVRVLSELSEVDLHRAIVVVEDAAMRVARLPLRPAGSTPDTDQRE